MALYAEGDGAAFRRLFELMAPRIRAFFLRSFADGAVADDLTQATFLKFTRRASLTAPSPLKPWVFTISCRRALRRAAAPLSLASPRGRGRSRICRGDASSRHSPEQSSDSSRSESGPRRHQTVPESQRVVVHLHRYEELTFEQIAEVSARRRARCASARRAPTNDCAKTCVLTSRVRPDASRPGALRTSPRQRCNTSGSRSLGGQSVSEP
jgi:RNA polymerase sigma-70 factor (ECF subfamily)